MRFPTVFINHGGGPLPLLGHQPDLAQNMKDIVQDFLPHQDPKAIVVLSAHWESETIQITSSPHPKMYFDYYGFPPESYKYNYPAPGSPELAKRIQNLLGDFDLTSELNEERGFDHGVFVPLMIMYPEATIPVVSVSLQKSLDATINMKIGSALAPLRDEGILILGSGYSFHNMQSFFNPSQRSIKASQDFNEWLKKVLLSSSSSSGFNYLEKLQKWESAPGARICHPREEHLLPLFMVAAAGGPNAKPRLVYDTTLVESDDPLRQQHAVTGYIFE